MGHQIGDIVEGTVTGIQPYGAFVVLDDHSTGLIHISEISDDFVRDVHYFVRVGEQVRVKVIAVDGEHGQLRLSLKALRCRTRSARRYQHRDRLPDMQIGFRSLEARLPEMMKEKEREIQNGEDRD